MDRRLLRAAPRKADLHHHNRFLRPGALARLRDSRIVARSLRSATTCLLPASLPPTPPASPSPSAEQQRQEGGWAPRFLGGPTARGLGGAARYPLRRRLAAARSVVFLPPVADAF